MGKLYLKEGADVKEVAARLRKKGYIIKQQLPDGSYVIYKKEGGKKNEPNENREDHRQCTDRSTHGTRRSHRTEQL